jgi:hypothetical protein
VPRDRSLCYRSIAGQPCRRPYSEHVGDERRCPGAVTGETYRNHSASTARAGTSFSAGEVALLSDLLTRLTRRGDCSQLVRSPEFAGVARKVLAMGESMRERKRAAESQERAAE